MPDLVPRLSHGCVFGRGERHDKVARTVFEKFAEVRLATCPELQRGLAGVDESGCGVDAVAANESTVGGAVEPVPGSEELRVRALTMAACLYLGTLRAVSAVGERSSQG